MNSKAPPEFKLFISFFTTGHINMPHNLFHHNASGFKTFHKYLMVFYIIWFLI